ncbi:MAG: energy transducer TonB [Rhodanobacter sp.]
MSRPLPRISLRHVSVIVLAVALAAAGGIFWHGRVVAKAELNESGPVAVEAASSSAPADGPSGTSILLGLARDAMHEGRLVAPAGNNAYEFYLSVLQLQPDNQTAQEALRESFPEAAEKIEHAINQQDLEEARREIDLLREFDSNNFTLALLGGKLSAARAVVTRQHEAEAERIQKAAHTTRT